MNGAVNISDPETYPGELQEILDSHKEVFFDYHSVDQELLKLRVNGDLSYIFKSNQYSSAYNSFIDNQIVPSIQEYSILSWHYTRLVPAEVKDIISNGMQPSTQSFLKERLARLVNLGYITAREQAVIIDQTPLSNKEQKNCRENRLWFVSRKLSPSYSGVKPLLSSWGGEVVYFWIQDDFLKEKLTNIGKPMIVEAKIPIKCTSRCRCIGESMFANYFDHDAQYDIVRHPEYFISTKLESDAVTILEVESSAP